MVLLLLLSGPDRGIGGLAGHAEAPAGRTGIGRIW